MTNPVANSFVIILENSKGAIASMRHRVFKRGTNEPTEAGPDVKNALRAHANAYMETLGWTGEAKVTIVGPLTADQSSELYESLPGKSDSPATIDRLLHKMETTMGSGSVRFHRMPDGPAS